MVFFPNAILYIAKPSVTKNSEGTKIKSFDFENPVESIFADVQPNSLTQSQIELYGINSKNADTKKCFFNKSENMIVGNRVKVVYNMNDNNGKIYDVHPVNDWCLHSECILIPVEN